MTLRRRGVMGEREARTQRALVAGGYGCDRGRRIAPSSAVRRHKASFGRGLLSKPEGAGDAGERLEVGGISDEPGQAGADDLAAAPQGPQQIFRLAQPEAALLRHEAGDLVRIERVAVE